MTDATAPSSPVSAMDGVVSTVSSGSPSAATYEDAAAGFPTVASLMATDDAPSRKRFKGAAGLAIPTLSVYGGPVVSDDSIVPNVGGGAVSPGSKRLASDVVEEDLATGSVSFGYVPFAPSAFGVSSPTAAALSEVDDNSSVSSWGAASAEAGSRTAVPAPSQEQQQQPPQRLSRRKGTNVPEPFRDLDPKNSLADAHQVCKAGEDPVEVHRVLNLKPSACSKDDLRLRKRIKNRLAARISRHRKRNRVSALAEKASELDGLKVEARVLQLASEMDPAFAALVSRARALVEAEMAAAKRK